MRRSQPCSIRLVDNDDTAVHGSDYLIKPDRIPSGSRPSTTDEFRRFAAENRHHVRERRCVSLIHCKSDTSRGIERSEKPVSNRIFEDGNYLQVLNGSKLRIQVIGKNVEVKNIELIESLKLRTKSR